MVAVLEAAIARANAIFLASMRRGRPPRLPRERAASSPALVLSLIRLRSNSAKEQKIWNTNFPPLVVVSIFSCRERNPMPRDSRRATTSIRFFKDRPSRSSRHTTSTSPDRRFSMAESSPARAALTPLRQSENIFSHPDFSRASFCNYKF